MDYVIECRMKRDLRDGRERPTISALSIMACRVLGHVGTKHSGNRLRNSLETHVKRLFCLNQRGQSNRCCFWPRRLL